MKRILTLLFLLFFHFVFSQSETQKSYLVSYGQVWGFLKYFHTGPSSMDWDEVLLNDFENVKNCPDQGTFDTIIQQLIERSGRSELKRRELIDYEIIDESFAWISSPFLSETSQSYLQKLINWKPRFENKYVTEHRRLNIPLAQGEVRYETYVVSPAMNYLALSRYWNFINYYYPYRSIIPEDWSSVYLNSISSFLEADSFDQYYEAVVRISSRIRDGHGIVKTKNDPPLKAENWLPFVFKAMEEGVFISQLHLDSNIHYQIQPLDKIVAINGIPVDQIWRETSELSASSNDYFSYKFFPFRYRTDQDTVIISVERNGVLIHDTLPTLNKLSVQKNVNSVRPHIPYSQRIDSVSLKSYLYIDLAQLTSSDINRKFKKELRAVDQIIIDARNYPSPIVSKLSRVLIRGRKEFFAAYAINFDYPGSLKLSGNYKVGSRLKGYNGKIYILVDYMTMSRGEFTVMALQQHPNSVVIGGQTAGADGNAIEIALPFGVYPTISGVGIAYPDWTPTQQVGLKVDYPVVQNLESLTEKRDLIYERAIGLIRNN